MRVGVLKEIKKDEYRVALTPAGAELLTMKGHEVFIEASAGVVSGFDNDQYQKAGAEIIETPQEIYSLADMVMHVKEPLPSEYSLIRKDQIVFTYLHLAANEGLTRALMESGCTGIAYETIQKSDGSLPLLKPMSEVAGRMAVQQAAKYQGITHGGGGVLLGGVPGVDPGTVLIIGGGVVGTQAAKMAAGFGATVYVLDMNLDRLGYLCDILPKNCIPLMSSPLAIKELIVKADVVVGAVLIPGAKAPRLVASDMLKYMKKGAIMVDVAIDQGGCFETSKATTHCDPTFEIDGILHYCVANMPGAFPKTSTQALTNATLPYALAIADKGWKQAMRDNPEIKYGANIVNGHITYKGVAEAFELEHNPIENHL